MFLLRIDAAKKQSRGTSVCIRTLPIVMQGINQFPQAASRQITASLVVEFQKAKDDATKMFPKPLLTTKATRHGFPILIAMSPNAKKGAARCLQNVHIQPKRAARLKLQIMLI